MYLETYRERMVDERLSTIKRHDALHGVRAKLVRKLAYREYIVPFVWDLFGPQKSLQHHEPLA